MLSTRVPKRQFSALATADNPISVRPAGGRVDTTLLKRIVTATSRRIQHGWTLDNLAEGIIVQAQEWSNVNSLNSTWSAQRCWLEFCASFEIEPIINERSLDERETIIVAFWAYMLKTIRPKRCARPAFKTLENYTSCVRKLHYDSGARYDVICLNQMPSFKYVRRQIQSFLVAHGPTEEAKPLVPLHIFRRLLRQWDLTKPLQALLGAIVLLVTFSGRRTGDVLPKLWSTFVAFRDLTMQDVTITVDRVYFTLRITKNRPQGPHWHGVLTKNGYDPKCCPYAAVHAYFTHLKRLGGHLHKTAPFFQEFNTAKGCFTGRAVSTSYLSPIIDRALVVVGGKQAGHCLHFRVEMENLLQLAKVVPTMHDRFMDWKNGRPQRQDYLHGLDPELEYMQQQVYAHFAAYVYEEPNEKLAFPDAVETDPGDGGAALAVHVFNP